MIDIERITKIKESSIYTWKTLKKYASAGKLDELLQSGDTIDITMKNGEDVTLVVGTDEKGTFYFTTRHCLSSQHRMNPEDTSVGGWIKSEMRKYLNTYVFDLLPDGLQAVIKPTKITQLIRGKKVTVKDKLFCISATQILGNGYWSECEPCDSQIDIFADPSYRLKNREGRNAAWWLRTADTRSRSDFRWVTACGCGHSDRASDANGVVFGFTLAHGHKGGSY